MFTFQWVAVDNPVIGESGAEDAEAHLQHPKPAHRYRSCTGPSAGGTSFRDAAGTRRAGRCTTRLLALAVQQVNTPARRSGEAGGVQALHAIARIHPGHCCGDAARLGRHDSCLGQAWLEVLRSAGRMSSMPGMLD